MAENNPELLNAVYKEISEKLGMDRQHGMGRSMDCKSHPKWVRDAIHNKECPNKIPRGSVL